MGIIDGPLGFDMGNDVPDRHGGHINMDECVHGHADVDVNVD